MRAVFLPVLLLSAVPVVAAPAPLLKPDRPYVYRQELQRFQGEWTRTDLYHLDPTPTFVFVGDRLKWRGRFGAILVDVSERFTLYPKLFPRGIDFASDSESGVERGIYRLDADTLTIAVAKRGEQRPTSFDDGTVKLVFRRKR
jgi:uncharacterized protein (TIGR03067 family)